MNTLAVKGIIVVIIPTIFDERHLSLNVSKDHSSVQPES
jgi:hypothetical protein